MNAIETRNLVKRFGSKTVLSGLDMTVPQGAIYGFIGENGSGKSTTEKILCGLLTKDEGSIRLFGKDKDDEEVRSSIGILIEQPGCFPDLSVWNNLFLQALNLGLENPEKEIGKVLRLVRMEGAASNKFKNCSLGMKQRIGIAMALLGDPDLLVLDEPINGLDADGMRIMREILVDLSKNHKKTILISSHVLGELEKIATHYGILKNGRMLREMTAEELDQDCPTYLTIRIEDAVSARKVLEERYHSVQWDEEKKTIRIYDKGKTEDVLSYLHERGLSPSEAYEEKIGLEEYYTDLMGKEDGR